jgi:hypothetical protein
LERKALILVTGKEVPKRKRILLGSTKQFGGLSAAMCFQADRALSAKSHCLAEKATQNSAALQKPPFEKTEGS